MATVLVTGGTGLLGQALVLAASAQHNVVALVHNRTLTVPGVHTAPVDVRDFEALRTVVERHAPDIIVNTAALVSPDACESEPDLATLMNVRVPGALAQLAARTGAQLVHISTDSVYGDAPFPFTELTPTLGSSVYARTKGAGEQAVLSALPDALVIRTNFFGWSSAGTRSLAEFFFNHLSVGDPVSGFTDVEFTPLYQRDLASLILVALDHRIGGVRNLGSSQPLSKYDFGRAIADAFGFDPDLVLTASRNDAGLDASRSAYLTMDSSRIAGELDLKLPTAIDGIKRFAEDYRAGFPEELRSQTRDLHNEGTPA